MDTILYESIYELNNIIAECNSEYIYESIILESEENNVIDVEYKEVNKNDKQSIEKKKSFLEKVKTAWKAFVATMKKMIKACIDFIKKNVRMIKDSFDVKVFVTDRSDFIDSLRELNMDTKSGKAFKNIVNSRLGEDYYIEKYKKDVKVIKMKKGDAIKFLEKQLNESNKLLDDFDKEVDKLLQFYDDNKHKMKGIEPITNKHKVRMVSIARDYYKSIISHIANDLQDLTTKKRDEKE